MNDDVIEKILVALEGATWEMSPSIRIDGRGVMEALSMQDYDLYREVARTPEARLLYEACLGNPPNDEAAALRARIVARFHPRDWEVQPPTPEEMRAGNFSGEVFRPSSSHYFH